MSIPRPGHRGYEKQGVVRPSWGRVMAEPPRPGRNGRRAVYEVLDRDGETASDGPGKYAMKYEHIHGGYESTAAAIADLVLAFRSTRVEEKMLAEWTGIERSTPTFETSQTEYNA